MTNATANTVSVINIADRATPTIPVRGSPSTVRPLTSVPGSKLATAT
ncbi:hypothetical protein [Micromonospora sp. NPDC049679]